MTSISRLMRVFVYGTLKRQQPNHHWLSNNNKGHAVFVCAGVTVDKFPLIVASKYNVPFLLNRPGTGRFIRGEVYEIGESMLAHLDDLEDYPQLYDRIVINVKGSDGQTRDCYMYVLNEFPAELLENHTFLEEYEDSAEQPYSETYLNTCTPKDLIDST